MFLLNYVLKLCSRLYMKKASKAEEFLKSSTILYTYYKNYCLVCMFIFNSLKGIRSSSALKKFFSNIETTYLKSLEIILK